MQWAQEGLSTTTRNHRLSALRVLWSSIITDPDKMHPCERVKRLPTPKRRRDRARRMVLIALVLEHVESVCKHGDDRISHAKAQLSLLAWTGQPAATMAQVRPEHFRPKADPPEFYMQPRRKGAGTDAAWKSLTPQGADALSAWLKLGASGTPWHNGTLRMAWRRATTKAQADLRKQAKGKKKADRERLIADAFGTRRHARVRLAPLVPDGARQSSWAGHPHGGRIRRPSDIRTSLIYMHVSSAEKVRTGVAALGASSPTKRKTSSKVVAFR